MKSKAIRRYKKEKKSFCLYIAISSLNEKILDEIFNEMNVFYYLSHVHKINYHFKGKNNSYF